MAKAKTGVNPFAKGPVKAGGKKGMPFVKKGSAKPAGKGKKGC